MSSTQLFFLFLFNAVFLGFFVKRYIVKLTNLSLINKKLLFSLEEIEAQVKNQKQTVANLTLQKDELITKTIKATTDNQQLVFGLRDQVQLLSDTNTNLLKEIEVLKVTHEKEIKEKLAKARKDAVDKSRSIIRGQASEHLAPYILTGTNPKDYRFMGNPIDYVCFEGLSDVLDKQSDKITCVHFIDIKTGKSTLNKSQRRIRDAINESRVKFSLINLDEEICKNDNQIEQKHEAND